jgi:hypothetical protein
LTNDAVRSAAGDETFGKVIELSANGPTLEVKGRKDLHRWTEVSELTFGRGTCDEKSTAGEHVQIRIANADGSHDTLEGAITDFDDNRLVLHHAVLGRIAIDRSRLAEIRFQFHGRRIPIDCVPRHLGIKTAFGFASPKPEGLKLKKTLRVNSIASGFIAIDAAHLSGKGTPVEVLINGETIGELNRLADRADSAVRTYRLPMESISAGDAEVEIRLRPPKDDGRVTGIDLRGVRFELHDPR